MNSKTVTHILVAIFNFSPSPWRLFNCERSSIPLPDARRTESSGFGECKRATTACKRRGLLRSWPKNSRARAPALIQIPNLHQTRSYERAMQACCAGKYCGRESAIAAGDGKQVATLICVSTKQGKWGRRQNLDSFYKPSTSQFSNMHCIRCSCLLG